MNLTINSLSSVDRAYELSSQNKNSKKENVSFEGLNISSKQVKNTAVGFALFAASVLGLSACKSNSSEKSKEAANTEYVAPVQDVEESEKSEVAKEVSYKDRINEYMAQDKKVVKVEIDNPVANTGPNEKVYFYSIVGRGYDKKGVMIRQFTVDTPEPGEYIPTYRGVQYLPDKTVAEVFYGPCKTVQVNYEKLVKFEGESGYKKIEYLYDTLRSEDSPSRTVIYKKGTEFAPGARYSKDYRECRISYDKDGKLLEKHVLVPDKDYKSLRLDEKKSILPKDISKSGE